MTGYRHQARWYGNDGSSVLWTLEGQVLLRIGPMGGYRKLGRAMRESSCLALARRQAPGRRWRRFGAGVDNRATDLGATRRVLYLIRGGAESIELTTEQRLVLRRVRLGRVVAYAARRQAIGVVVEGANPARSLFERPLTINEIRRALERPDILELVNILGDPPVTEADVENARLEYEEVA